MRRLMHGLLQRCSGLFSVSLLGCLIAFHALVPAPIQEATTKEKFDVHSIKALRARIAKLKAQHHEREEREERAGKKKKVEKPGQKEEESEEEAALDYLEGLEAWLAIRAYPNDFVDWDALRGAKVQRDQMSAVGWHSAAQWEFLGPRNCASPSQWAFGPGRVTGRVNAAAFDPTDTNKIYIASSGGGAWKSVDAGVNWTPMGDGWTDLNASCIEVDPTSPNKIYVGTGDWDGWGGYSHGIERSLDGGQTWTNVGRNEFGGNSVRRILIDPDNGQIITVVTGRGPAGNGKVWRTTDGGNSWAVVINVNALWSDIVCSANDGSGNRTYYACASGSGAQVWSSTTRGATWTKLTVPMRTGNGNDTADLACSPTAFGTVYLLGTGDRKVWKSTTSGSAGSWTDITTAQLTGANWGQAWYDFYLSCSTKGTTDVLYVGLIDILQSWDGGATWRSFIQGYTGNDLMHVDEHNMIVNPTNPHHMLACCDGGVYNVVVNPTTGVATINSLNANLALTEFYWGDFHPTDGQRMIGGTQDNGSPASLVTTANWRSVTGGDGGAALINQTTPNIQYTTYQNFGNSGGNVGFNRTNNNWSSSTWVQVNVSGERVAWMGPLVMAATDSQLIYLPTNYLRRYNNANNTWTGRLGNQALSGNSTVLSIGVTKADQNVIYTGSGDGQLWVSRNFGTNWTQINTGSVPLPNRAYTAIRVRDDNINDTLVGLSGTGVSHLWRCFDTSAASRVWVNVSGSGPTGLPDTPINTIERDPADPINTWYVGTDIGVFKTSNAGNSWENITRPLGLPNVAVTQLRIRNNYLCAVTYGRGMWRLNLTGGTGGSTTMVGLTLNPSAVVGPAPSTGTVTISAAAPIGGATVALSSNSPAASVPTSVTVPEGSTTASFAITTTVVPSQVIATITGTLNATTATSDLTVNPNGLTNITLNPVSVIGGNPSTGTVSVATPAPVNGTLVQLNSSNTAVATVPASVTIPQGQTSVTFTVTTIPTANDANSTIKATVGTSTVQTQLTVNAPVLTNMTLNPTTVVGGNISQGTITLNGKAPAGGAAISMASSDTNIATVPATVTVPANATSVVFNVTSKVVQVDSGVTVTGIYHGIVRSSDLTVLAQKILSLTMTPNPAVGGNIVQGRVTLAGPAIGNIVVSLSSNSTLATVPPTVTIANGQTSATFNVATQQVAAFVGVSIFASFGGSSQQTTLTLGPLFMNGFSLSTNATFERQTVIGTVSLNGPALAGGAVISLSQSNPNAATIPTSVTIPAGQSSKTFTITAKAVASTQFTTITATRGTVSLQQTLSVTPINLQDIQLTQGSVTGGINVSGVVRLVAPAPTGGYVVTLSSSNTSAAKVPVSVTIPAGQTTGAFTVTTFPVAFTQFVTIKGTHGLSNVSTQLQVVPPEVKTFTVSPTSIKGGSNINGTVTLTGKAPAGGMTVTVQANPNLAHPASTVVVPAGQTSKTFVINTNVVFAQTIVTISARTLSITKTANVTLRP